jgi:PAP2 superfamily
MGTPITLMDSSGLGHRRALFVVLACSFVIVLIHAQWFGGPPVDISFLSAFASFGYASIGCQYVLSAGSRRSSVTLLSMGIACGAALAAVLQAGPMWMAKGGLIAAGAVGILAYTRDALRAVSPTTRTERLAALRDALIVPLAVVQVPFFLWANARLNPVFDARVYGFEHRLGVPLAHLAMQSYSLAEPFSALASGCYLALPIGLSVIALKQPSSGSMTRLLWAVTLAGACGFMLYAVCPVVGPVQAFSPPYPMRFPALASTGLQPVRILARVPRNGMPSLHTVWALLIVFNTRSQSRRWRATFITFAVLTVWAALGRYQHWFMDLVVAVPLAVCIQVTVVANRTTGSVWRWMASAACAATVVGWLIGCCWAVPCGWRGWRCR